MESWSYVNGGKMFVQEQEFIPETFARNRNTLMGWHVKSPLYGNNLLVPGQQTNENQSVMSELGLQDSEIYRKHLLNGGSTAEVLSSKGSVARIATPSLAAPNAFSGEEESTSKLSSSVVDSYCQDSLLIDLKLGRFADYRETQNSELFSSVPSSTPAKRSRPFGSNSQTYFCQVHGCNKDLSSSKDYHKRHKVCEVHSKTAKVIVNGIEQRFCQQCSREIDWPRSDQMRSTAQLQIGVSYLYTEFHVLSEFDDGKRSCRKRLAGHNERRRKPQGGSHSGRTGRFQSFDGTRHAPSSSKKTSFICQDILSSGLLHAEKYGASDWSKGVKIEARDDYNPPLAIPITSGRPHSKTLFSNFDLEKQYPSFNFSENSSLTGSIFRENGSQYSQMSGENCSSQSFFPDTSLGSEDLSAYNTTSNIPGFPTVSSSGALSLLSSRPHNSTSHSSKIPMAHSLDMTGNHAHYNLNQDSEKFREGSQLGPILISEGDDAVNFEDADGFFHGLAFSSAKDRLSCQDGATIDLFQLSSHLQGVERQRQSMQVKQENDVFCFLRIT